MKVPYKNEEGPDAIGNPNPNEGDQTTISSTISTCNEASRVRRGSRGPTMVETGNDDWEEGAVEVRVMVVGCQRDCDAHDLGCLASDPKELMLGCPSYGLCLSTAAEVEANRFGLAVVDAVAGKVESVVVVVRAAEEIFAHVR